MTNGMYWRKKIAKYFKRTYMNKIAAIAMIGIGYVPVILDGDGTALVLFLMLAVPLFFTSKRLVG